MPARPLTPSDTGVRDTTIPFAISGRTNALLRGQFVHRLFEILPDLPPSQRSTAASRIADIMGLGRTGFGAEAGFSEAEIAGLFAQVEQVMALPELAVLFGNDALAEANISGLVGGVTVQGQIDRMAITSDKIIIADFKTGMPPENLSDIPPAYLRQMALYGGLAEQIYPARKVECLLIWTQIIKPVEVPETARNRMLENLIKEHRRAH